MFIVSLVPGSSGSIVCMHIFSYWIPTAASNPAFLKLSFAHWNPCQITLRDPTQAIVVYWMPGYQMLQYIVGRGKQRKASHASTYFSPKLASGWRQGISGSMCFFPSFLLKKLLLCAELRVAIKRNSGSCAQKMASRGAKD